MMNFKNRDDAAGKLADELQKLSLPKETLIIALPRGGVVLGRVLADRLHLPLTVLCSRKIRAPYQPEYALGAITEDGTLLLPLEYQEALKQEIETQKERAKNQALVFRKGKPLPDLKHRPVILVDDGLATGLTMRAAVEMLKKQGAQVTLAVPCAATSSLKKLSSHVEHVVCLIADPNFMAVSQYYKEFNEVSDSEVQSLLHPDCK